MAPYAAWLEQGRSGSGASPPSLVPRSAGDSSRQGREMKVGGQQGDVPLSTEGKGEEREGKILT